MDIEKRRAELLKELENLQEQQRQVIAQMNRVEGAIWLCNDILNEGVTKAIEGAEPVPAPTEEEQGV